jgi:hypothetical protein
MDHSCHQNWPLITPNHIRLLTISAQDRESSTISCTLESFGLDEAPPYIALSYTWDTANDQKNILLNPGNVTLPITKNCYSALLRLRTCYLNPENTLRHFWIDAISIDQSSVLERNSQVAMMAGIYRTASRVVIDVGEMEASEDADLALNAITRLEDSRDDDDLQVLSFQLGSRVRDSVRSFYERPWFKRMWVLQEAFMAEVADVMCGTRIEQWAHFRLKQFWLDTSSAFGRILVRLPPVTPNYPAPFVMIQGSRTSRTFTAEKDFLALLCHSRVCDAGDPRDKVFALYSFLSDAAQKLLRADYSDAITKALVYTRTTEWLLNHCGLSVLSCVWGDLNKRDATLPSWVPDWANSIVRAEWHFGIRIREEHKTDVDATFWSTSAAGETKSRITVHDSFDGSRRLVVRGLIVDRIQITGNILEMGEGEGDISQLAAKNRSRSSLSKITHRFPPIPNTKTLPNWMRQYGLPAVLHCAGSEEDISGVYHNTIRDRAIAVTECGYLGPVPEGTREGDSVCILLGAGVPFVLRFDDGYWRLVGEAYIYGLMRGEALSGEDLSGADGEVAQHPFLDFVIR